MEERRETMSEETEGKGRSKELRGKKGEERMEE